MLPQVTFRGLPPTQTVVDTVWRGARKLSTTAPQLTECHVVIETVSREKRNRTHGNVSYHVTLHATAPDCEHDLRTMHATAEDVFAALAHAFAAALHDLQRRQASDFPQDAEASRLH